MSSEQKELASKKKKKKKNKKTKPFQKKKKKKKCPPTAPPRSIQPGRQVGLHDCWRQRQWRLDSRNQARSTALADTYRILYDSPSERAGSAQLSSARLGKRLLHHGNILINFSADSPVCLGESVSFYRRFNETPRVRVRGVLVVLTAGKCHLCGTPGGRGCSGFFERFFWDVVDKSSINPPSCELRRRRSHVASLGSASARRGLRCRRVVVWEDAAAAASVAAAAAAAAVWLPWPLRLGCRTRAHAGRHARTQARSLSACDARRSVLPSKLVALATLSSDLNMVAPMLKQMCGVSAQFPLRWQPLAGVRCQSWVAPPHSLCAEVVVCSPCLLEGCEKWTPGSFNFFFRHPSLLLSSARIQPGRSASAWRQRTLKGY